MTLDQIKRLKESEHKVEFKEAQTSYNYCTGRRSILGYVVALANEKGGRLILGVKENKSGPHHIVGSAAWQGQEGKLEEAIYRDKQIRVRTEVLYDQDGKRILVIDIPSRPVGKTLKHEDVPLMRIGEDLLPMSDEQIFKILQEQEPDFSARICDGLSLHDLDANAIHKMKEKYAVKQKNPSFRAKDFMQVLNDLQLTNDGRLTYAALILLGKGEVIQHYLPQANVTWEFRFSEGQINNDFRENICLPIFDGIDKIWSLINSKNGNIPVRAGAYISELPVFNEEVIREAVLNAIVHRDYSITSEVVIRQYPKRMIINNPGGFPRGVTIENLLTVSSTPRSRLMAEVLEKTGLVERSGQGIDKIFSFTLSEGKPAPSYNDSDMFQVSLHLSGELEDKAFHLFINEVQKLRGTENILGAEKIIGLYKVRSGSITQLKPSLLTVLEQEGLITKASNNSSRYILAPKYQQLASKEQRIGKRYLSGEIKKLIILLQGKVLKISDLEKELASDLNRNQLKYLISKLSEDNVIEADGMGKGTRYTISGIFEHLKGEALASAVINFLRKKYEAGIATPD